MESQTIAEILTMPACKIIVRTTMGKVIESEIDKVPVFDNTISRCMDEMSHNAEDVLSEVLTNTNFALQVDKSTDITNKDQLLAFIQYNNKGEIMENFLL
jgi:hypothetical protein